MAQHSAKGARFQAVTANRLTDGEVVYLTSENHGANQWSEAFSHAAIADGLTSGGPATPVGEKNQRVFCPGLW